MNIFNKKQNIHFNPKFAITNEQIQNGMMGRTFNHFNALIFLFDVLESNVSKFNYYLTRSYPKVRSFWMKNCIIPLDMVFATKRLDYQNTYQINKIFHNCQPCNQINCPQYQDYADIVIELPGNTCNSNNISEGDFVSF